MKYLKLFETDADYQSFIEGGNDYVTPHVALIKDNYDVKYQIYEPLEDNYLTIEALEDDLTVSFGLNTIQYSIDNCQTWNELPADTETPAINAGDMISFKATGLVPEESAGIGRFTVDKNFNLKGNVMSMLFGDKGKNSFDLTGYDYAFYMLFAGCDTLQSVSKDFLPATALAEDCYSYMFAGCASLVESPALPATTLADSCYEYMFEYCSSLVTAPELPATTLADYCYYAMFYGCSSLTAAPELPATTLADSCYYEMFSGTSILPDCTNIDFTSESVVASGGLAGLFAGTSVTNVDLYNILPINPSTGNYWLPVTTLADSCYSAMFYECSSLVTAPDLPATELAPYCYNAMFVYCSSMTTTPELPATTLAGSCYSTMFYGCLSLTAAPELPVTTLASGCYNEMFYGCTSLVAAPELPATTLADSCYHSMFYNCSSLVNAPELPATTLADYCYYAMFYGCSSLTAAPELPATTLAPYCYSYMFGNCTSLVNAPELPATTLADYCYNEMFMSCRKLNYIKALFTTTPGYLYTSYWVDGVSSTGTFVKNSAATWDVTGDDGIPEGWTVETATA